MRNSLAVAGLVAALGMAGNGVVAEYPIRSMPDLDWSPRRTRPSGRAQYGSAKRKARNRVRNRIARLSRRRNRS